MRTIVRVVMCIGAITIGVLSMVTARAQDDDVFAFIPSGGRTLLSELISAGTPIAELDKILEGKRSREEWLDYLKANSESIEGLSSFDETQMLTLADYLSFNTPLPADRIPPDPASADWNTVLPRDGRDLVMTYCQSCHIITVVITQDRTKDAWLGTMNKPSHVEIDTTPEEREALASYLVINAGIPIDLVPEELRAGGATY